MPPTEEVTTTSENTPESGISRLVFKVIISISVALKIHHY